MDAEHAAAFESWQEKIKANRVARYFYDKAFAWR
jgi:hypothetical protein